MQINNLNSFKLEQEIGRYSDATNSFTPRSQLNSHSFSNTSAPNNVDAIETKNNPLFKRAQGMCKKSINTKISLKFLLKKIISLGLDVKKALKTPFEAISHGVKACIKKIKLSWEILSPERKSDFRKLFIFILILTGIAAFISPPSAACFLGSMILSGLLCSYVKGHFTLLQQKQARLNRQRIQQTHTEGLSIQASHSFASISPIRLLSTASDISINSRAKTELMD